MSLLPPNIFYVTDFSLLVVVRLLFTLSLLLRRCSLSSSLFMYICISSVVARLSVFPLRGRERNARGTNEEKKSSSSPNRERKKKVEKYTREEIKRKKKSSQQINTKHTSVPTLITFTKNDTHEEIQRDLSSLSLRNDALFLLREQPPKRDGGVRVSYFW